MALFNRTMTRSKSATPNNASNTRSNNYFPYLNSSLQAQSAKQRLDSFNSFHSVPSSASKPSDHNDDDEDTVIHRRQFLHETSTPSLDKNTEHPIETYFSFDGVNNDHLPETDDTDPNSDSEELGVHYTPIHKEEPIIKPKKVLKYYSLDDALKTLQFGRFHKILIFIISIIYFSIGIQAKITNILYFLIEKNNFVFNIPSNAEDLLYIAFGSGGVIGIYLAVLADKFGRKNMITIACVSLVFFTLLQVLSFNWAMLVISRLFIGCCSAVAMIASVTLLIEYVPNPTRFRVLYFIFIIGIISYGIGSLIAYIVYAASTQSQQYIDIKYWRILMAIISTPVWFLPILNYLCLPNSPHFVALDGNTAKVMEILKTIEYYNRQQSFFNLLEQQQLTVQRFNKISRKLRGRIVSLFVYKEYRKTSVLLCFISFAVWFAFSTIYQIQYLFVVYLQSNGNDIMPQSNDALKAISVSTNFAVESIVTTCDFSAALLTLIFMNFMERKRILMFGFGLSTMLFFVIMIVLLLIDYNVMESKVWNLIGIALVFITNMSVALCYYVLQIYCLEYYATVVRTTSLGFIFYGIGSVALILSFTMSMVVGPSWIMCIFYSVLSIIGFQCCRLLDIETKNKPLDDHIVKSHQKNLTSKVHYDYIAM